MGQAISLPLNPVTEMSYRGFILFPALIAFPLGAHFVTALDDMRFHVASTWSQLCTKRYSPAFPTYIPFPTYIFIFSSPQPVTAVWQHEFSSLFPPTFLLLPIESLPFGLLSLNPVSTLLDTRFNARKKEKNHVLLYLQPKAKIHNVSM